MNKHIILVAALVMAVFAAPAFADCEDEHWVKSVSSDGEIVVLEDGSIWQVDSADTVDSALWLPTTNIVACDDKLINTDDSETIEAAMPADAEIRLIGATLAISSAPFFRKMVPAFFPPSLDRHCLAIRSGFDSTPVKLQALRDCHGNRFRNGTNWNLALSFS